jgi:Tol biopolymer transport system component/DNA-binding winged helix-turn-helix (wHTH) protein
MEASSNGQCRLRFGFFETDLTARELYKRGLRVHLQDQPFQILVMLLEHPGKLVGRGELQKKLWPLDTFVEFDEGLNTAMKKLRYALGDSADNPRFIETVPRQGYRFIAPVKRSPHVQPLDESILLQLPESKGRSRMFIAAVTAMILIAAGWSGIVKWNKRSGVQLSLQKMSIKTLTDSGKATNAAISSDGKFVVYTLEEGEQQGLWLKQVATGTEVQILPPDKVQFLGETFSADGNYIFFVRSDKGNVFWRSLYEMPVLGGIPRQILRDVDTPISLSPDGKQFAFLRGNYPKQREDYLIVGNMHGGEKVLAIRKLPQHFGGSEYPPTGGPVWSPDGRTIAVAVTDPNKAGHNRSVLAFSLSDAKSKVIYSTESQIGRLQWLPGGNSLLLVIADGRTGLGGQLWELSYPAGEARKVTNDLSSYDPCCLDISGDLRIAAVQAIIHSDLWIAQNGDAATARQLTSGQPIVSNSWMKASKIVFGNLKGEIFAMDLKDQKPILLIADGHNNSAPSACGDGRYIVFVRQSPSLGHNLWRMQSDGSNVTELTHGRFDQAPVCSHDGKWVIYQSDAAEPGSQTNLWRISIDGGAPMRLTHETSYIPRVSPDGKLLLYYKGGDINTPMHVVVIPADGGQHLLSFPLTVEKSSYDWSPDGRGLDYVLTRGAISNLWRQPLTGGPAQPVTNFKSGQIFTASWSQGDKQLLFSRGEINNNAILISNLH